MRHGGATNTKARIATRLLLLAVAAGGLLFGAAARAEEDDDAADEEAAADEQAYRELTTFASEIELGFLFNRVDGDESAFAQYRGLDDDETYALGRVDVFRRAPWDGESTQYYGLQALNLGLDSRYVGAEYGHQGVFGLSFLFDELPVYKTRTAQSFFVGVGSSDLTLPPGWVAGGRADQPIPGGPGFPTAFQSSIFDNLDTTNIGWQRRKYGGAFSLVLPADMEFAAHYSYETKKGEKLLGSVFGLNGGDPRSVIIPSRIDYATQQFDGALRYNGEKLQLELGYFGSAFHDDENSQTWMNPYTANPAWDPSAGFQGPPVGQIAACVGVPECGTGQRSQPPDNWFNQIIASGGYDLPYRTRVTLQSAFGWSTQDESFLPYSINPVLTATTPGGVATNAADLAALPRNSLEGEIFTTVVDFGISSRPLEKLRIDSGYRYERRDNETPRDVYIYVRNDSTDQGTLEDGTARINMPYSLTHHEFALDAGYALPLRSELALGYEWDLVDRDYQEVDELQSNTLSAMLISRPIRWLHTRINYEHVWQDGSGYDGSNPFIQSHTTEFLEEELAAFALPGSSCALAGLTPFECLWENHPLLRKYYLADMHRDKVAALLTVVPHEDLTVSASTNYWYDDFYNSHLGLRSVEHFSPGVDISYLLNERISTYAYYNYERRITDSQGLEFGNIVQSLDPTREWSSKETVHTHTAGAGFNVEIIRDRLGFGVDYLFARSEGDINTVRAPGSALAAPAPFPDLVSNQNNVSVHADYRFTENFSMRLGYLYQDLETNDWAYDGLTPTSLSCSGTACVIGTGQKSPHYTANVVSWSVVYTFW